MSDMKRNLYEVVATIINGEFYVDYDQSVSDLGILRQALIDQSVLADLKLQLMQAEKKMSGLPEAIVYDNDLDDYISDYLGDIQSVVIANSYERHKIWAEYAQGDGVAWETDGGGYLVKIGLYYGMPVCLSVTLVTINGKRIIFADPTSTVVNHDMINEWVKRHVTPEKNPIDSNNFHIAL